MSNTELNIRQTLNDLKVSLDHRKVKEILGVITRDLPKKPEYLELFQQCFDLVRGIPEEAERREAVLDFAKGVPAADPFMPLYTAAAELSIDAADSIDEAHRRITELLRIAGELPKTKEFIPMRVRAWRLAMGFADKPRFQQPDIRKIARELPKANDYAFYRRYTLLGIAKQLPKEDAFQDVYKEAIELAIGAAAAVDEPYYMKYALMYIAEELRTRPELYPQYKRALIDAHKAALALKDPFAKEHALIDLLQETPKTDDFFALLQELLQEALNFFTVRRRLEDVEIFDVVDFILSAEETGINESKARRFSREKYANIFSKELDKFGTQINDIRFIEVLKPYNHVWVQPKSFRDSVKKVVDHLESLKNTYRGSEIERPVFVKEVHLPGRRTEAKKTAVAPNDCIAIDIGATNTVIMRKKSGVLPEFVTLGPVSKKYGNVYTIPTILSAETNAIGAEVTDDRPVANIKQMLMEGNPKGREFMERFLRTLSAHLRKAVVASGWFTTIFSKGLADCIYITVPVGFTDYKNALKEIAEKSFKGTKIEFIEEPLAAALGYEVAEDREKVVMAIDFGGATLNTMILRLSLEETHVVAKPDRAQVLGGHDIDIWLAEHLAGKVGLGEGEMPYRLIAKAEEIKIALSNSKEAAFEWNGKEVCRISREEFEEILDKHDFYRFIDRFISYVIKKAEKVGIRKERIEAVLLTGGSSQIPSFKEKIGHIFPVLRIKNLIYDHSPLSAVGNGAAVFGTREVTDRHLGMAYAVRYATKDKKETPYSYSIMLEKGDTLPLEKTFKLTPARKLGTQDVIFLELFEVPDSLITRRWVREEGVEFLKQEISQAREVTLRGLKTITLSFDPSLKEDITMTLHIDETGLVTVKWGPDNKVADTGIRLQ